jgi:SAM-dependent methyltransferase
MTTAPLTDEFYDREYFNDGTKSNYAPYGPGDWADWLFGMVVGYLNPWSVLDVGCAYGYMVERYSKAGIEAAGFDLSSYAIEQSVIPLWTWQGDATDIESYHGLSVDLITATEFAEHLTPEQFRAFLRHGKQVAKRMLLLIAVEDGHEHHDKSHINLQVMDWWENEAREAGWTIGDSSAINNDPRSKRMQWDGRFLLLTQ